MVLEIIAGLVVGGAVGYFTPQLLIKLEQKNIRARARARIEKQDYDYYYKTNRNDKQVNKVDLKKIIKNSTPGIEPWPKKKFNIFDLFPGKKKEVLVPKPDQEVKKKYKLKTKSKKKK